jgi:hypothetical protein
VYCVPPLDVVAPLELLAPLEMLVGWPRDGFWDVEWCETAVVWTVLDLVVLVD